MAFNLQKILIFNVSDTQVQTYQLFWTATKFCFPMTSPENDGQSFPSYQYTAITQVYSQYKKYV
jgi:hypothetical protein